MANTVWTVVDKSVFLGIVQGKPTAEEWNAGISTYRGCRPSVEKALMVSYHTFLPTALQRKAVNEMVEEVGLTRSAVLTNSTGMRAICTTISWFVKDPLLGMFAIDDLQGGLDWLQLDDVTVAKLKFALNRGNLTLTGRPFEGSVKQTG